MWPALTLPRKRRRLNTWLLNPFSDAALPRMLTHKRSSVLTDLAQVPYTMLVQVARQSRCSSTIEHTMEPNTHIYYVFIIKLHMFVAVGDKKEVLALCIVNYFIDRQVQLRFDQHFSENHICVFPYKLRLKLKGSLFIGAVSDWKILSQIRCIISHYMYHIDNWNYY